MCLLRFPLSKKIFPTMGAFVRLVSSMSSSMDGEVAGLAERFPALITRVGILSGVDSSVCYKGTWITE